MDAPIVEIARGRPQMKTDVTIKAEGGILNTIRKFLADLLREGVVDYLLVTQEMSHGRTLTQTLVKDPSRLKNANPFSPVMAVNSATIVSRLTADKPQRKLGAVLKPCEIRALIELAKLDQASIDNLVIIGIDCLGTFEVEDYAGYIGDQGDFREGTAERILLNMRQGMTDSDTGLPIPIRSACRICDEISPSKADMVLSLFGADDGIIVSMEKALIKRLNLETVESTGRDKGVAQILKKHAALQTEVTHEFREKMKTVMDFADALATCTQCYACQSACPICYCRTCFFRTETFEPESERYFRWAEKEDVLRMPTEMLLFHLTRLNHVAASCVGCGMCESNCPRGLPLTTIYKTVSHEVQKQLNYTPGRSVEDEIPVCHFREAERSS
jgi:formate dehydrogenase subunit beta